ncbi:MAG: magnesium transporter, partial [Clostridia bacterium]
LQMASVLYNREKNLQLGRHMGIDVLAIQPLPFVKILLVDNLILHNDVSIMVALVVCITLVATVIFAKIVGALLPLLAKQIGFDPAVMASPFITTIVDALSLIVYFNVAQLLIL